MPVTSRQKLVAGTAAVAIVAGGGAAIAATQLTASGPHIAATAAGLGYGSSTFNGRLDGGPGPGFRNFGGRRGGATDTLGTAATYLGISTSTLQSDLASGKTLAQIAKTHDETADGLVNALVAAQRKQLDAAVAAGRLSQAQEQSVEPLLTQRIKDLVDGTRGGRLPGFGRGDDGGGFGDGGGGFGGGSGGGNSSGGSSGTF